jgi:hypothetical protein
MASTAAAPVWQALKSLDRAPDQRVLGFAARVALELSKAGVAPGASPDVRKIIGGGDAAKWDAPSPDKLWQTVDGTARDLDPSKLKARDWVPMPSTGQVAVAKAFVNSKVMCEELSSWRISLKWDNRGCCNLGCGAGLQYVVCRVCGVVEQESGKKHLDGGKASRAVHDARAEEQRRTAAVRATMRLSAQYAGSILGKRERSAAGGKPWAARTAATKTAHNQLRAKMPVTHAPSESTAASTGGVASAATGGVGGGSGSGSSGSSSSSSGISSSSGSRPGLSPRPRTAQQSRPQLAKRPRTRAQSRPQLTAAALAAFDGDDGLSLSRTDSAGETHTGASPRAPTTRSAGATWDVQQRLAQEQHRIVIDHNSSDDEALAEDEAPWDQIFGVGVHGEESLREFRERGLPMEGFTATALSGGADSYLENEMYTDRTMYTR